MLLADLLPNFPNRILCEVCTVVVFGKFFNRERWPPRDRLLGPEAHSAPLLYDHTRQSFNRIRVVFLRDLERLAVARVGAPRRVQYAALPYRLSGKSRTEVMLVTSRETQRWIIPKGWPQRGKTPHDSAAREAFEEAGVVGAVGKRAVGSFPYQKRLKNGGVTVCEVHVFPLKVRRQSKQWPEKEQREVKWVSAKEAAETVKEPMLSEIIRRLAHKTVD
jgi:8-oxo-dGTP pyrophosphatase MutT (NUDIX family)